MRAGLLAGDGASALKEWQAAGVFAALHQELLRRLNGGAIDWSTAVVDGSGIRALQGGPDRPLAG